MSLKSLPASLVSHFMPGQAAYSFFLGATGGIGIWSAVMGARVLKVRFLDYQYEKEVSRKAYMKQQLVFQAEQDRRNRNQFFANVVVAEYDPVATRVPFEGLDSQFVF